MDNNLKTMEPAELRRLLAKTREELRATRFRVRSGQEKDVRSIRELRVKIAQLLSAVSSAKGAKAAA